ncbi:glycoside hydrolase family 130 protein [Cohnella sp. 56]|uniref:glycoside hydrolase family 130 protein n=1 Tax=Cohnella sp. 56 TaxID=3113722 RepID=UPI0030E7E81D
MSVIRMAGGPVVTVGHVKPSRPDFQAVGAFNAGVAVLGDETILLLRVAEMPLQPESGAVLVPMLSEQGTELELVRLLADDPNYDFSDSRVIKWYDGSYAYLTSMSHLRIARSLDGERFVVDERPAMFPTGEAEAWGIEDPRITQLEDTYYITYSAVSSRGVGVGLAKTRDFVDFERSGMILPPENKDAMFFPERIGGKYYMLHRPVPRSIGAPEMWIAESPDLLHWGGHRYLMGLRPGLWDGGRIGGGAVPIRTDRGWLVLYHGADADSRYCMGAALLDLDDPARVLARSRVPLLAPEADYEVNGFFGKVVFSCGAILAGDTVRMYYGAADEVMARADIPLADIWASF